MVKNALSAASPSGCGARIGIAGRFTLEVTIESASGE
jgi:hypothetical protein